MHFLIRGKQIAFHFVGDEFERFVVGVLVLRLEPSGEPRRQFAAFNRQRFDRRACSVERFEPRCLLTAPVEFGQTDQRDGVGGQLRAEILQRFAAFDAGLAARNAQLEYALRSEQLLRLRAHFERRPVKMLLGGEHFALAVAVVARLGADTVACFKREQRLGAEHGVKRRESAFQNLRKLFGRNTH